MFLEAQSLHQESSSIAPHFHFFEKGSPTEYVVHQLARLATNKVQESACLCLPIADITGLHCPRVFRGF